MTARELELCLAAGGLGCTGASIFWWIWAQSVLQNAVLGVLVSDQAARRWTPSAIIGQISGLAYNTVREFERAGFVEARVSPGGPERGGRDRYEYRIKDRRPPS